MTNRTTKEILNGRTFKDLARSALITGHTAQYEEAAIRFFEEFTQYLCRTWRVEDVDEAMTYLLRVFGDTREERLRRAADGVFDRELASMIDEGDQLQEMIDWFMSQPGAVMENREDGIMILSRDPTPDPVDAMISKGMILENYHDMAKLLPDIFPNGKAAKAWFKRNPAAAARLKRIMATGRVDV